jgi:Na+-transporting NADH:ubiquinone oxidoreductase subunit C
MSRDSVGHTIKVAFVLCVVCSVLVSGAAVTLRPLQQANQERERKSNILAAAGLREESRAVGTDEFYRQRVIERIVDLETGQYVDEPAPEDFNQRRAGRDPAQSIRVPGEIDLARVRQRERHSFVYLVRNSQGEVDQVVLPIRGYGLWSTLWGFLSLDAASIAQSPEEISVRGITYYEHGETPGLGGEVDNPRWKDKWREDKRVYDADWKVLLRVERGAVDPDDEQAEYKVDGLSGATITANGVTNMIAYWFGDHGFKPFLKNAHDRPAMLAAEGGNDG